MLRFGVLGTGFVVDTFHMPSLRELNAQVVAVGSRRSEAFAKKWGIGKYYQGDSFLEQLCSDNEVDVVLVALPNFLHEKAVTRCAEEGKHVIVEKPLGRNSQEAERSLAAVERAGVLHGYAENQVFIPQIVRLRDFLNSGVLGDVVWVRSREAHSGPHSGWFWDRNLSGGGSLLDMGCHSVEVARKLFGIEPSQVLAWGELTVHRGKTEAEDNSVVLMKFGRGLGQAENSWTAKGGLDLRYEVYGTDGSAFVDVTRETGMRLFTTASDKVDYVVEKADIRGGWMYPVWREHELYGYLEEMRHFLTSMKAGENPKENLRDGLTVNRIIDAAYKSVRTGKWEPP
ncbi:oxidoreductase [Sulfodiicoccus acidiphilus]|uniref:Oxidoreductase n=1 Tax=Sulfodiicoccus acidiphilus TaxID=1670455 RepID=A0A348B530_9CREN|nr:Gfo/Idh/MocA family oxidoreductase [Sulfodiicoccus acidiphilus]BBD73282.1 oxidoreductase [Sulfodiicoccus acidiphilus]GGT89386.1 oxidoreductase [Sulfodiicoccus acidiphilus]